MATLLVCGCMQSKPPLPGKESDAKAQVENWVPIGTPMADAQRTMEQHGFKCEVRKNGEWGAMKGVDFIHCDFSEQPGEGTVVLTRWQVALFLENSKVKSEDVVIQFTGP